MTSIETGEANLWQRARTRRSAMPSRNTRRVTRDFSPTPQLTAQRPSAGSQPQGFSRDGQPETPYLCEAMKFEELSAEELVTRALALAGSPEGDRCANELFERHYSRVAYWCLRFSGDRESAADLAQEIFARAHRALKDFQGHSKFSTWLYTITRNHCLNAAKSRSVRPIEVGEEALAELPGDDSPHPGERESSARLANQVLEEALDETEKRVFTLHYGDELTLAAITRLLGLTNDSGAKAYIVSAKRKLNRYLQRWRAKQQRGVLEEGEEQ